MATSEAMTEASMWAADARLQSFSDAAHEPFKWPHPPVNRLQAELLAESGWYYAPTEETLDNTTCFICNVDVGGWEATDDPVDEHVKHTLWNGTDCPWALVKGLKKMTASRTKPRPRGKRKAGQVEDLDFAQMIGQVLGRPLSMQESLDTYERACLQTYGNDIAEGKRQYWVHDRTENSIGSDKMAAAGFFFEPTLLDGAGGEVPDDHVVCAFCRCALSNWEVDDAPLKEHTSRDPSCPYLTAKQKIISEQPSLIETETIVVDPPSPARTSLQQRPAAKATEIEIEVVSTPRLGSGRDVIEVHLVNSSQAAQRSASVATIPKPESAPAPAPAPAPRLDQASSFLIDRKERQLKVVDYLRRQIQIRQTKLRIVETVMNHESLIEFRAERDALFARCGIPGTDAFAWPDAQLAAFFEPRLVATIKSFGPQLTLRREEILEEKSQVAAIRRQNREMARRR